MVCGQGQGGDTQLNPSISKKTRYKIMIGLVAAIAAK